jgi:hypothetical protein
LNITQLKTQTAALNFLGMQASDIILSDTYIRPETNYTKAVIQLDLQLQKECRQRNERSGLHQFVVRDLHIVELAGDKIEKNSEQTTEQLNEHYRALTYDPIFLSTKMHETATVCCWLIIGKFMGENGVRGIAGFTMILLVLKYGLPLFKKGSKGAPRPPSNFFVFSANK